MRIWLKISFLASFLLFLFLSTVIFVFKTNKSSVLGLAITPSSSPSPTSEPTPTLTPTPSPTPTPTPTLTPAPTPSPTPPPQIFSAQQIQDFYSSYAGQYGVDVNLLKDIAACESEGNPFATNAIYQGLFQFGPYTWNSNRSSMGEKTDLYLRLNAQEAIKTAAYVLSVRGKGVWPNCIPESY